MKPANSDVKSNDNIFKYSIAEILAALTFLGGVYTLIYKYGFYEYLGVPSYIGVFSFSTLLITSLGFLIVVLTGLLFGYILAHTVEIKLKKSGVFGYLTILTLLIVGFIILYCNNTIENSYMYFLFINYTLFFFILFSIYMMSGKSFFKISNIQFLNIVFGLCLTAFLFGKYEAIQIEKSQKLNQVIFNKESNWLLVEILNEKAIIMSKGKENKTKIVDIKDVEILRVTPK